MANLKVLGRSISWKLLCVVVILYVALLAAMLFKADGIPYGLDGNETFSSAIHARNLSTFSLRNSFGLTDESYANDDRGHPMVHSHQGNFPRLFTFLIYQLGAHEVRGQIIITCLTIGIAAIVVTFLFFNVTADGTMAFIACMVFLSDYLLFGQWFLNTYRIWHSFFFFSSLFCVLACTRKGKWAVALTAANFFCLCYWEYVFATFVVLLSTIYAFWYMRRTLAGARRFLFAALTGLLAAAGTLFVQLVAYVGWRNTLTDIFYTLHARNSASNEVFSQTVAKFYSKLNILFWPNYLDVSKLRNWEGLRDSIFARQLEYYSPWLAFLMIATAVGWCLALVRWPVTERVRKQPVTSTDVLSNSEQGRKKVLIFDSQPHALAMRTSIKWRSLSANVELAWTDQREKISEVPAKVANRIRPLRTYWRLILRAVVLSAFVYAGVLLAVGHRATPFAGDIFGVIPLFRIHPVSAIVALCVLAAIGDWLCFGPTLRLTQVRWHKVLSVGCFLLLASLWFRAAYNWFDWSQLIIWSNAGLPGGSIAHASYIVVVLELSLLIAIPPRFLFDHGQTAAIRSALRITFCGLLAYSAVYFIFTGYVYSGYLYRQAPFLVFITDPLLALVIYTLFIPINKFSKRIWLTETQSRGLHTSKDYRAIVILAALIFGCGTVLLNWFSLQKEFFTLVPINNYSFLSKLSLPPYRGKSFVVDTYAAPVSVQTHAWAYMEPVFFGATLRLTGHGFHFDRESTYKWFADADSNPFYEKPDYAISIRLTEWDQAFMKYKGPGENERKSLDQSIGIVARAEQTFQEYLYEHISDVDSDKARDSFAIVKLDWDYPAYLLPLPPKQQRIAQSIEPLDRPMWDVWIEASPQISTNQSDLPVVTSVSSEIQSYTGYESLQAGRVSNINEFRDEHGATRDPFSLISRAALVGRDLTITLATGPTRGNTEIRVNDSKADINLFAEVQGERSFSFHSDDELGTYIGRARPIPGQYVALSRKGPYLDLQYVYAQQDRIPEDLTSVDIIGREPSGALHLISSYLKIGERGSLIDLDEFISGNRDTVLEYSRVKALGDNRSYLRWLSNFIQANVNDRTRTGVIASNNSSDTTASQTTCELSIPIPKTHYTRIFALLRPGTPTKSGPIYPSNTISLNTDSEGYGAVQLDVHLPTEPHNQVEPLLSAGTALSGNLLYVIYDDLHTIRLGFSDRHRINLISPPLDIDRLHEHEVIVSNGSLLPAVASAYENSMDPISLTASRRQVDIRLDGQRVFEVQTELASVPPSSVRPGVNSVEFPDCAVTFSGTITGLTRLNPSDIANLALVSKADTSAFGPITLEVKFPINRTGVSEPLVTTGVAGAGDFVYVTYFDENHVQLAFDHWGVRGEVGLPMQIDYAKTHQIRISMGSLFPQDGDFQFEGYSALQVDQLKNTVLVELDGRPALSTESECYESPPGFVTIGENRIGGSTTGPTFTGMMFKATRIKSFGLK